MTATQRLEVYDADNSLAAVFAFGAEPLYIGEAGGTLVSRLHFSYDPFGSGLDYAGLRNESPTALLAAVASAVHSAGYRVRAVGIDFPTSLPGVVY